MLALRARLVRVEANEEARVVALDSWARLRIKSFRREALGISE